MKIALTLEEAYHLAASALPPDLNVRPADITIELPKPEPVGATMNTVEAIYRIKRDYPRYGNEQKISAIKAIRTWIPGMGLADAKNFIETIDAKLEQFWNYNPSPRV